MPNPVLPHRQPLLGKNILITRPQHQADALSEWIEDYGGRALRLPLLEIADTQDPSAAISLIKRLQDFDLAIFISPNAVIKATELMQRSQFRLPASIKIAAIGKKTAKTLTQHGYQVNFTPDTGFTSEDFLSLAQMQNVRDKRIIIFRGQGGRDLLRTILTRRGAEVEYIELYQRIKPDLQNPQIQGRLKAEKIDLVMITSPQALQNWVELIQHSAQRHLFNTPLLVGSERMAEQARSFAFSKINVAKNPSDESMHFSLLEWAHNQEHDL